jgi:hypothetical protein
MQLGTSDFWRDLVHAYVHRFPVSRGKSRLMEALAGLYAGAQPQTCQLPGGARMQLDLSEPDQRRIYFFGVEEAETVEWFRRTIRPGMTFLDIGARDGQYSLLAATGVGPQGRVHAFEPGARSFSRLTANIALNAFDHVHAHALALTGEPGVQLGATLDQWAHSADLGPGQRIDIMKIDGRGLEEQVIRGGTAVLRCFAPTIICQVEERRLNDAGSSSVALKRHLEDLGYRIGRVSGGRLVPVHLNEVHRQAKLILTPDWRASC